MPPRTYPRKPRRKSFSEWDTLDLQLTRHWDTHYRYQAGRGRGGGGAGREGEEEGGAKASSSSSSSSFSVTRDNNVCQNPFLLTGRHPAQIRYGHVRRRVPVCTRDRFFKEPPSAVDTLDRSICLQHPEVGHLRFSHEGRSLTHWCRKGTIVQSWALAVFFKFFNNKNDFSSFL